MKDNTKMQRNHNDAKSSSRQSASREQEISTFQIHKTWVNSDQLNRNYSYQIGFENKKSEANTTTDKLLEMGEVLSDLVIDTGKSAALELFTYFLVMQHHGAASRPTNPGQILSETRVRQSAQIKSIRDESRKLNTGTVFVTPGKLPARGLRDDDNNPNHINAWVVSMQTDIPVRHTLALNDPRLSVLCVSEDDAKKTQKILNELHYSPAILTAAPFRISNALESNLNSNMYPVSEMISSMLTQYNMLRGEIQSLLMSDDFDGQYICSLAQKHTATRVESIIDIPAKDMHYYLQVYLINASVGDRAHSQLYNKVTQYLEMNLRLVNLFASYRFETDFKDIVHTCRQYQEMKHDYLFNKISENYRAMVSKYIENMSSVINEYCVSHGKDLSEALEMHTQFITEVCEFEFSDMYRASKLQKNTSKKTEDDASSDEKIFARLSAYLNERLSFTKEDPATFFEHLTKSPASAASPHYR